jgi:citrate lyase subunit beta/citryl-CoA lyase
LPTVSALAKSYLFVPATRLDRVLKALGLNADVVIVDLEDAVGDADKVGARASLGTLHLDRRVHVRVNALGTPKWRADVEACSTLDVVEALVVPMVESPEEFEQVRRVTARELPLLALVETPRGVQAVDEIAAAGFDRLLFGGADYSAALACAPSNALFAYPRARLAVASAAGGLPPPVDGPTTVFDDAHLREDLAAARALGMGGKLCIHPSQLDAVREAFAPSAAERDWAQEVVETAERHRGSVFSLNGQMIDQPIIARARSVLES